MDPWLWGPAAASVLAPLAARWRTWAGWAVWGLALLAAGVGFLLVAAGTVLLGLFGSLIGFSPDWGAAAASFGAPAVLSTAVLAATWYLTHRVAGRADPTPALASGQHAASGGTPDPGHERTTG